MCDNYAIVYDNVVMVVYKIFQNVILEKVIL